MSFKDAYKPNLKRAADLFKNAAGSVLASPYVAVQKSKEIYHNLRVKEIKKNRASDYEWKRVGGSQPIRVKKKGR